MSRNLINCMKQLELVAGIKNTRTRNSILRDFANDLSMYDALREIAVNTIKRNVPLSLAQKRKLRRYKKTILELASKRVSKTRKKQLLIQSGGFLPVLVPAIASIIGSIITARLNRNG